MIEISVTSYRQCWESEWVNEWECECNIQQYKWQVQHYLPTNAILLMTNNLVGRHIDLSSQYRMMDYTLGNHLGGCPIDVSRQYKAMHGNIQQPSCRRCIDNLLPDNVQPPSFRRCIDHTLHDCIQQLSWRCCIDVFRQYKRCSIMTNNFLGGHPLDASRMYKPMYYHL